MSKGSKRLPDQELVARLAYEVKRSAEVWNFFAGSLIDGWLPGPERATGSQFKGSDRERLEQLFKIRDFEVRHQLNVLRELGLEEGVAIDYPKIYAEVSKGTEITSDSYESL